MNDDVRLYQIQPEKGLEQALSLLEARKDVLDSAQLMRLQKVYLAVGNVTAFEPFEPSDLDYMHGIARSMLQQVTTDSGNILSSATIRDVSSLTGAMTSLLRLFTASQKNIDSAKELRSLHDGVIAAISALSKEDQQPFWDTIQDPVHGFVDAPRRGDNHG